MSLLCFNILLFLARKWSAERIMTCKKWRCFIKSVTWGKAIGVNSFASKIKNREIFLYVYIIALTNVSIFMFVFIHFSRALSNKGMNKLVNIVVLGKKMRFCICISNYLHSFNLFWKTNVWCCLINFLKNNNIAWKLFRIKKVKKVITADKRIKCWPSFYFPFN